jgi:hypothetical protein
MFSAEALPAKRLSRSIRLRAMVIRDFPVAVTVFI